MKKCPHGPSVRVSPFNLLQASLSMSPENPCAHRTGRLSETSHGPPWPKGKALTRVRHSRPYPTLSYSPHLLPTQPSSLHLRWSTHLEPSCFRASTHSIPQPLNTFLVLLELPKPWSPFKVKFMPHLLNEPLQGYSDSTLQGRTWRRQGVLNRVS